jgi:hypothetical protein
MSKPLEITKERIESKVHRITESGCWVWMGATQVRGYGEIITRNRKLLAHRASYEVFVGPIPKGMYVCHACDNVYCVNPNHLFLGTQKQNLQDMKAKGRSTWGERNPRAKLKMEQVVLIKEMLKNKSPVKEIAEKFNVSEGAIRSIKEGKNWSYV